MSFRFRKRIKLIPGLRSGISASIGGHGLTANISRKGVRETVGLPGTGISYQTKRRKIGTSAPPLASRHKGGFWKWLLG